MAQDKAPYSLKGQRVVIVGGTSGMGLGAARAAVKAGAEVVVAGRRPEGERSSSGGEGKSESERKADRFEHASVDITDEPSIRRLFERVGELDHLLVTATPPARDAPFLQQDLSAAQAIMNGKFFGSWACARHAAPRMRAGGSITFLTGGAAIRPRAGLATVTATFAALEALSQALALELGPLRVNTLRPGVIDSDMWSFLGEAGREKLRQTVRETFPVRRIGTVEDVGQAAVFLMTNPYVTGAVLEISGGETLVKLDI
jgi:NAD(P)-dependent dehydrogenase (short-subunit alcohol dehydrogenase family)